MTMDTSEPSVAPEKRQREAGDDTSPAAPAEKRQKTATPEAPVAPEERKPVIRKQIEYYFSDGNMKRDRYFHPLISSSPEGWLDVKHLLGCAKLKKMTATAEEILESLSESHLETKTDENKVVHVRRTTALPPLEPPKPKSRPDRKGQKGTSPKSGLGGVDMHAWGCILKVTNVPSEASWETVKKGMKELLDGKGDVRFVDQVTSEGESFVLAKLFEGDQEYFKTSPEFTINGETVKVVLETQYAEACKMLKKIPRGMYKDRERELNKLRRPQKDVAIHLAGTDFRSVDHLRKCCRELITVTDAGKELNKEQPSYRVVRDLLDYHPRAAEKTKDIEGIKVDLRKNPDGTNSKCFFILKKEGEPEDFSVVKCIESLSKNPPMKEAPAKAEAPTTEETGESKTESPTA